MRSAVIDIGTNTILMLIADINSDGTLSIIKDEHFIARLGKGVDEHGVIRQDTFYRVREILLNLKLIANNNGVQHPIAFGTSALRDAANRQEFIKFIKNELSIEIQILSGEEEAKFTYLGVISEYLHLPQMQEYAILDIGGGSTELVTGVGPTIVSSISIDIGSVRLTERILKTSPPDIYSIENAISIIQDHLLNIDSISQNVKLFGVAGTLTTLASLDLHLPQFDRNIINQHILTMDSIEFLFNLLKTCTLDQLIGFPQIHPLRADILVAGILILREVLKKLQFYEIVVSDRGLRYGLILNTANNI